MNMNVDAYGPGVGDGTAGPAARLLRDQLTTRGLDPNLQTALAAIAEMQEILRKERREGDRLERQIGELGEKLQPDRHTLSEAQRALADLTRGRCGTAAPYYHRDGTRPSHDSFHGYHSSQLAHTSTPTLDGALRAISELCAEIHDRQHEESETVLGLQADLGGAEEEIGGLREELRAARQELRALQRPAPFVAHAADPFDDKQLDTSERDAIEREPASVWTLLRRPAV